jgi:HSP20 family protein
MELKEMVPWNWGKKHLSVGASESEPFYALQRSMNEVFDTFFRRFPMAPFDWGEGRWGSLPRVNVTEKNGTLQVEAELPGLDEKDIEVSVSDDLLTIKGERKEEKEETEGKQFFRREISFGSFQRSIPLPSRVKADGATATFKKGVLKIVLPIAPEEREKSRKIEVRAE